MLCCAIPKLEKCAQASRKKISLQGSFFPFHCQLCSFSHDSAKDFATVQRNEFSLVWCAGIPNEATTTADGKTMRTTNHFQSQSHPREKIVKIAILDHVHTALSSVLNLNFSFHGFNIQI